MRLQTYGQDVTRPLQLLQKGLNPEQFVMPQGLGTIDSPVSPATRDRILAEAARHPELKDLALQIGETSLSGSLRNIADMDAPLYSKLLRVLPAMRDGLIHGYLRGADHYDPMSHTLRVYSDNPAIGLHELGHAKDLRGRGSSILKRVAVKALGRAVGGPEGGELAAQLTSLRDEPVASGHAARALGPGEARHVGQTLLPAFGSYLAAATGHSPMAGLALGGGLGAIHNLVEGRVGPGRALGDVARAGILGALGPAIRNAFANQGGQ